MKTKVFIFYLLIFATKALAQGSIKGKLIDSETKKFIPFASITYIGDTTQQGFYSDSLGIYNIKRSVLVNKISMIGYETKLVKISNLLDGSIIELTPIIYSLNSVEIKPKKTKTFQLGYYQNKIYRRLIEDSRHYLMYRNRANYVAQLIPNTLNDENLLVTKILYNLSNHFKKSSTVNERGCEPTLLRLHLFEVDKFTGKPGKELMTKNVIFKNDCESDNLAADITKENIYMPINGIFAAIEFIDDANSTKSNYPFYVVELNTITNSLNTYYSNHQQNWEKRTYDVKANGKIIVFGYNAQFGIEVVK